MDYKLAVAGAEWWIRQMKKSLNVNVLDSTLAEQFSLFEKMLINEIHQHLKLYHYINFGCCYYPSKMLTRIAENVGISTSYFPIHAQMEIVNNTIQVSLDNQEKYMLNTSTM